MTALENPANFFKFQTSICTCELYHAVPHDLGFQ